MRVRTAGIGHGCSPRESGQTFAVRSARRIVRPMKPSFVRPGCDRREWLYRL
jgi:hypothetical protein